MSASTRQFISDIQGGSTNPEEHCHGSHLAAGWLQGLKQFHSSWDMQAWCTEKDAPWTPALLHFYPAVCVQGSEKQDTKQKKSRKNWLNWCLGFRFHLPRASPEPSQAQVSNLLGPPGFPVPCALPEWHCFPHSQRGGPGAASWGRASHPSLGDLLLWCAGFHWQAAGTQRQCCGCWEEAHLVTQNIILCSSARLEFSFPSPRENVLNAPWIHPGCLHKHLILTCLTAGEL